MSDPSIVVLDSSVGVKWLKPEAGSQQALALLDDHRDRRIRIVVPSLFLHEVTAVAVRCGGAELGERVWQSLQSADLTVAGLDDTLAAAAFKQVSRLGCSFYDALAPALAGLLGGTLYSADTRAHERVDGVVLLG
ncbi:MAG: type II toxin-antitoxin system VapC family toxin [Coriobacteriia bacterium]|nr:type II toxin-antitoxin system VapC family toxin [Coriobacteriia bacterium]